MPVLSADVLFDRLGIQKKDHKQFQSEVLDFFHKDSHVHLEDSNFDGSMMLDIARRFIITERCNYYFGSSPSETLQQPYDTKAHAETLRILLEKWSQRKRGNKQKDDPSYSANKASPTTKTTALKRAKAKQTAPVTKKSDPTRNSLQEPTPEEGAEAGPSTLPKRVAGPLIIADDSEDELPDVWDLIKPSKQTSRHRAKTNTARQLGSAGDRSSDRMEREQFPNVGLVDNIDVAATSTSSATVVAGPVLTPPLSAVRGKDVVTDEPAKDQEQQGTRCDTPVSPTPSRVVGDEAIAYAESSGSLLPGRPFGPPSTSSRAKRPAPDSCDADDVNVYEQESHPISPCEESSSKRIRLSEVDPVMPHSEAQPQRGRSKSAEAVMASSYPAIARPPLSPFVPPSHYTAVPTKIARDGKHSVLTTANDLPSTLLAYVERVQDHTLAYTRSKNLSIEKVEEAKTRCKFLALLLADLQSRVKSAAAGAEGSSCSELSLWI